jgi:hypothetical protein
MTGLIVYRQRQVGTSEMPALRLHLRIFPQPEAAVFKDCGEDLLFFANAAMFFATFAVKSS